MKVTMLLFSIHDMRGERIEGMDSRERVLKALNHEEPDSVPKDLGATNVTGINVIAYNGLLRHLGLREEIETIDPIQGLAKVSTSYDWPGKNDSKRLEGLKEEALRYQRQLVEQGLQL